MTVQDHKPMNLPPGAMCARCNTRNHTSTSWIHYCPLQVQNTVPFGPGPEYPQWPSVPLQQTGWLCPACGKGVAPFMPWCPCGGRQGVVTTTNETRIGDPDVEDPFREYVESPVDHHTHKWLVDQSKALLSYPEQYAGVCVHCDERLNLTRAKWSDFGSKNQHPECFSCECCGVGTLTGAHKIDVTASDSEHHALVCEGCFKGHKSPDHYNPTWHTHNDRGEPFGTFERKGEEIPVRQYYYPDGVIYFNYEDPDDYK